MTKNTKAIIWATIAVMAVIIGGVTYERQKPKRPVTHKAPIAKTITAVLDQTQTATSTEAATSTPDTVATSTSTLVSKIIPIRKPKPVAPKALSYGDAVAKYTNSRIQFNSLCQAIPGQVVFANLTTVMLDNRSDSQQKITIAGQTYIVDAYNYALVTLKQTVMPITLHVGCNNNLNSVEITVE
ncbi:MAG: hypothetical protein WC794_05405 [Candidatus Doudnabacteria bacterium]|jgi:hypothetical protein